VNEKPIQRREFLKRAGLTGLAVAGAGLGAACLYDPRGGAEYFRDREDSDAKRLSSYRVERSPGAVTMAIARGSDPDLMVRAALGEMGGIRSFVQVGDVVLIKPNVAFDRAPILGATTSPQTLKAVARLCLEAGAEKVIVADNPINQPEGCFFKSGIQRAAAEIGAELVLPKPSAFEPLKVDGEVLSTWPMFYRPFERAAKVIGIAPCKDHNLCSASMTTKNWYGLLGGRRNQFHQRIHGIVSDFPHMIKPTLVVLDATRILMRNGPTGGSLSDVAEGNTLIVGTDMVAVDTFGYTLLGRDPARLEYLQKAEARGLGSTKWKQQNWREIQVG
jgi:uncharacterized protein (DUF362 family)